MISKLVLVLFKYFVISYLCFQGIFNHFFLFLNENIFAFVPILGSKESKKNSKAITRTFTILFYLEKTIHCDLLVELLVFLKIQRQITHIYFKLYQK